MSAGSPAPSPATSDAAGKDAVATNPAGGTSNRRRLIRRFLRNRLAVAGCVTLMVVVLAAVFAPWIAQHDPYAVNLRNIRHPPSAELWLGGDPSGRDVFSRVLFAARVSLSVGFLSVVLNILIGTTLGLLSGYYGGWLDAIIMRLTDTIMALPGLLLILMFVALLGPSLVNIILILGVTRWAGIARLVRGQVLSVKETDFVAASRAVGAPAPRIMVRHIFPNIVAPVIVAASFAVGSAILAEASLSFLGLGVKPPTPSWGGMLNEAQSITILKDMTWYWIPPGLMIAVTVLSINFVGDGLRDALDPQG